jgi:hypothetical protein
VPSAGATDRPAAVPGDLPAGPGVIDFHGEGRSGQDGGTIDRLKIRVDPSLTDGRSFGHAFKGKGISF